MKRMFGQVVRCWKGFGVWALTAMRFGKVL